MILPARHHPPAGADATAWATRIHRHLQPRQWPQALAEVPEEKRAEAEAYLRGIAARMRVARNLQQQREALQERRK